MFIDFGRLGEIIKESSIAQANKNNGPIAIGSRLGTFDYNFSSSSLDEIYHNEIHGVEKFFMWSFHTWDDRTNIVK